MFAGRRGILLLVPAVLVQGCGTDITDQSGRAAAVSAKAAEVSSQVGGSGGFGGELMEGYAQHMPSQMGFHRDEDLAPEDGMMMVHMDNETDQDATFHVSYFASHIDMQDHTMDVDVRAGEDVAIEIPCSEIVGMGPLEMPGEAACHLEDGMAVDNMMALPGFMNQDFECEGTFECRLEPDVDDLDGDGDTEELIVISESMEFHLMDGGPKGHMHGSGFGMMGGHMGGR